LFATLRIVLCQTSLNFHAYHHHAPEVAGAEYISTMQILLQNSEYKISKWNRPWGVWLASSHMILFWAFSHCSYYIQCFVCRLKKQTF